MFRYVASLGLLLLLSVACAEPTAVPTAQVGASQASSCDPMTSIIECPSDPTPTGGNGYGLHVGFTWTTCLTANPDVDADGINDNCEIALAQAFAPALRVHVGECNWDSALNRVGGEYYYSVRRPGNATDRIRIGYLPAYYRDCGVAPHTGDSEFIGVDVRFGDSNNLGPTWQFVGAFLSSHCAADVLSQNADPNCRYFGREHWEGGGGTYASTFRGAPVVWVASGKHANYISRNACNASAAGVFGVDSCFSFQQIRTFPVQHRFQNLDFPESGSTGCVPARWGSPLTTAGATEWFGPPQAFIPCNFSKFHGWVRPQAGGSTSYDYILRFYLKLRPAGTGTPPRECMHDPVTAFFAPC